MGTQVPSPKGAEPPQFSAHICCGIMAGWIKMLLGKEVGLGRSDIVLDEDSDLPPQKEKSPPTIFSQGLLWPNGLMDQDATWYGGRPQSSRRCIRWEPISPQKVHGRPPFFSPCLLWPNSWMDEDATWYISRPQPRPHCIRQGPSSPPDRGTAASAPVFGPCQLLLSSC